MRNLPKSIQKSINYISNSLPFYILDSRYNRTRQMRSDYQQTMQNVLIFLLKHMDCRSRTVVRNLKGTTDFVSMTAEFIAIAINKNVRTVYRVLEELKVLKLIECSEQTKQFTSDGIMIFSDVIRKISRKFFQILNCNAELEEDIEYAFKSEFKINIRRAVTKKYTKWKEQLIALTSSLPPSPVPIE